MYQPCGDGWLIPEHIAESFERTIDAPVVEGQVVSCVVVPGADIYAANVLRGVLTEEEATTYRERDAFYDILVQRGIMTHREAWQLKGNL